jgi:formylglycine-generating enzyme required for sulfatase activity
MGAPSSELGQNSSTKHAVTLSGSYYLQTTEVTQSQWMAHMGKNPSAFWSCPTCPVEMVNWWEALAYANALSSSEGLAACYSLSDCQGAPGEAMECSAVTVNASGGNPYACAGYRLPSEAEWEYAYRAGTTTAFHNGDISHRTCADATLDAIGWYCGNAGGKTQPAAQLLPNAWGLYDMSGNVAEWCWDWYAKYAGNATDPLGPASGSHHVYRGGAWYHWASYTRAATRMALDPQLVRGYLGFRVARSAPP